MIELFTATEAVTMENFNERLTQIRQALPSQNVQVAAGSYVGTGVYGSDNPNSLTFDFAPDFLVVAAADTVSGSTKRTGSVCFYQGMTHARGIHSWYDSSQVSNISLTVSYSDSGNTVSWYADSSNASATLQLNDSSQKYAYFAIGVA